MTLEFRDTCDVIVVGGGSAKNRRRFPAEEIIDAKRFH